MPKNCKTSPLRWYREPWLWLVLAPLIAVVLVSMVTVSIAFNGADDLVVDNYYREGRMLSQDYTADEYAKALGLSGQVMFDDGRVQVELNKNHHFKDLRLLISHPAESALDRVLPLQRVYAGLFQADYEEAFQGRWYLRLSAYDEGQELWRMHGEIDLSQNEYVSLN